MAEFRVTDYGATGDGITNDTSAFQAVAAAVNNAGGGTIVVPPGVYVVGRQVVPGESGWDPEKKVYYQAQPILHIKECAGEVVIRGEPERGRLPCLRAADGLRFGSFDPRTGDIYSPPPEPRLFDRGEYRAEAYGGMIWLEASQSVVVRDLELDGNCARLVLGGRYGDTGWQVSGTGLLVMSCRKVDVRNVHTHHHGQDGIIFLYYGLTPEAEETPYLLEDINSEYNCRQALTWAGGIGLTALRCKFNYTGRGGFSSAPGAGVDVEAEESVCRKGWFVDCEFLDNEGVAFVADSGDSEDVHLLRCRFFGTTAFVIWPARPKIVFEECEIYGTVVRTWGDRDAPSRATQFLRCHFEDRDYLPGRPVFCRHGVILASGDNVLFDLCTVVGNKFAPLMLAESDRELIRDTVVICRAPFEPNAPDCPSQSIIIGSVLENVEFRDEIPADAAGPWQIHAENVEIRGAIWVQGPRLRWANCSGPSGVIGNPGCTGFWFLRLTSWLRRWTSWSRAG